MSLKLCLGVTDAQTVYDYKGGQTVGDVAQKLEDEYHIMQTFAEMYQGNIAKMLESSVAGALESVLAGAPSPRLRFEDATSQIETLFRQSLEVKAYDGILAGVPTKAAIEGVSHRFMNVYNRASFVNKKGRKVKVKKRRPSRPSFIDSGLYQRSMAAWIES